MLFSNKFKPSMLDKWRVKPPKYDKFKKLRDKMDAPAQKLTAAFAWEQGWPEHWLGMLPDNTAAALLADCWTAGDAQRQKAIISKAILLLKQDAPHRDAAKGLLLSLADQNTVTPLLAYALSAGEDAARHFTPGLLAELLAPWPEQTGRSLLMIIPSLSDAAKMLALQLTGLLKPSNTADIIRFALNDSAEDLRVLAAKTAGVLNPSTLTDFLAPALADASPSVRAAACETLGLHCGSAAIPILRRMLAADDAWTVKSMCSSFITKWESALAEQIRLDEGELFLKDSTQKNEVHPHAKP